MPPSLEQSSMTPGELATCEDFLDSHREYATDLLSDLEEIYRWHSTDNCAETLKSRCTLCELCSPIGLMGAAKSALASFDVAEEYLNTVRTSLGKSARTRGEPGQQTLFKDELAKVIFFSIVTAGDALRSQHATWQARLQSETATSRYSHTGPGKLGKHRSGDLPLSTYSGPNIVGLEYNPKLTALPPPMVSEPRSNPSMFVVLRRCLSSDCPCEANRTNIALKDACKSQVPPSHTNSKKARMSKVMTRSEAGGGSDVTRSGKTSDTSRAAAKAKTSARTLAKPSLYHDLNSPNTRTPKPQDVVLEERASSSGSTSGTALLTRKTETASQERIVDPRVFHLQALVVRSDGVRKALMEWCRIWMADPQLDPGVGLGSGLQAPPTAAPTTKDARGPPVLARRIKRVKSEMLSYTTGHAGEAATKGLSHGDKNTITQDPQFDSEQEEFKGRWQMARQKRSQDRKGRSSGCYLV